MAVSAAGSALFEAVYASPVSALKGSHTTILTILGLPESYRELLRRWVDILGGRVCVLGVSRASIIVGSSDRAGTYL